MTPPPSSSSSATCRAYDVLCDVFLMRHITSFQCGLPRDIIEWMRANESRRSPWGSPQNVWGLLPNLAVQTNNLRMLERLYRYHKQQPAPYDLMAKKSFDHVWSVALKCGNIEMAEWIEAQDPMLSYCENESEDKATIACAITSPGVEMTKWLLERRPHYKQQGHLFDMNAVAATGNTELFQWLVDNIKDIQTSTGQMDVAAKGGHLDMVRYLHEHSAVGCTTNAMDKAAGRGHLEVIKFLHEHRTEGCSSSAMDDAACVGDLEVVRFLHEHRTEGCTTTAMDFAARYGHLEVIKFLHENRTEGATEDTMTFAAQYHHFEIVKFLLQNRDEGCHEMAIEYAANHRDLEMVRLLHEHYPDHPMDRALYAATDLGQLDIVQYIVENTTQGCVFRCLEKARELGFTAMDVYLTTIVDPLIQKCDYKHDQEDTKRVCQKYETQTFCF